jgi:hypothetical protein
MRSKGWSFLQYLGFFGPLAILGLWAALSLVEWMG